MRSALRSTPTRIITTAKLVRRDLRRIGQMVRYRRNSLDGVPILFANAFPKSGTHLLMQVIKGLTKVGPAVDSGLPAIVTYDGITGELRNDGDILMDLRRLRPADIAYGHLHSTDPVTEILRQSRFVTYFIIRDPRDVVVSHAYYVTEIESSHVHHRYYTEELMDFDERLRTSIIGRPDWGDLFPNITARFEPYLGWLTQPETLVLQFEDFINDQDKMVGRVLDHAVDRGYRLVVGHAQAVGTMTSCINPVASPTFRSGKIGSWREKFSPQNKQLFKDVAGELLIQLGYEQTKDW